jgi:hypothetical protein
MSSSELDFSSNSNLNIGKSNKVTKNKGSWFNKSTKKMLYLIGGSILLFIILFFIRKIFKETFQSPTKLDNYFKKNRGYKQIIEEEQQKDSDDTKPKKSDSKGEILCRKAIEKIFDKPFIKVRPDFLKNNVTKYNLELDIYNSDLKLAVEYNGKQHYEYSPFFHRNNYQAFLNQKYRDEIKRMLCKQNEIKLIEVPYTVPFEDIESYIRIACRNLGYDV